MKYKECTIHPNCRHVKGSGSLLEIVKCPWCDYRVSTSNPAAWCAGCYTLFRVERGRVHFGKSFQKGFGQALAISIAKQGGMRIGTTGTDEESTP